MLLFKWQAQSVQGLEYDQTGSMVYSRVLYILICISKLLYIYKNERQAPHKLILMIWVWDHQKATYLAYIIYVASVRKQLQMVQDGIGMWMINE
jgi:hypothetical protein